MNLVRHRLATLLGFSILLGACAFQRDAEPVEVERAPVQLFLIGDSTMSIKAPDRAPETGWGMVLPDFAKPELQVKNHAMNGRSSKSFYDEGRWQAVLDQLQPGDYVVIQFGHNDEKIADPARYTEPRKGYMENLHRYVEQTRAKGAHPILVTPICRRRFDTRGELQATHGDYPAAMRDLASGLNVPLVDMQAVTWNSLQELGPDHSVGLYLHLKPGQHPNYPSGKADNTHLSRHGALWVTHLFLEQLRGLEHPLAEYFYGN